MTEWTVVASVSLTLPADNEEEAATKAAEILNRVDGWPTVDIDEVMEF